MKRIKTILVLLLAIGLIAVSALPRAAHAVVSTATSAAPGSGNPTATQTSGTGDAAGYNGTNGDPGGAGDGLGADPSDRTVEKLQGSSQQVVADLITQLLRLLQAAG